MKNLRKTPYKIGIVKTENHSSLLRGQAIEIISEENEFYLIRVFLTGQPVKIKKEDVLVN